MVRLLVFQLRLGIYPACFTSPARHGDNKTLFSSIEEYGHLQGEMQLKKESVGKLKNLGKGFGPSSTNQIPPVFAPDPG